MQALLGALGILTPELLQRNGVVDFGDDSFVWFKAGAAVSLEPPVLPAFGLELCLKLEA